MLESTYRPGTLTMLECRFNKTTHHVIFLRATEQCGLNQEHEHSTRLRLHCGKVVDETMTRAVGSRALTGTR